MSLPHGLIGDLANFSKSVPLPGGLGRRELLRTGLAACALTVAPQTVWSSVLVGETGNASMAQRRFLTIVCDLVIPTTDTPGAAAVGVPAFVELALDHGLEGTHERTVDPSIRGIEIVNWLSRELDRRLGGDFLAAAPARQVDILTRLDADAHAEGARPSPWRKIKDLILIGYYTSETGATKELQYELVPGRFDPDIPIPSDNRSWSSDWTAVDYG